MVEPIAFVDREIGCVREIEKSKMASGFDPDLLFGIENLTI